MPFGPDDKITRSLWVMFIGEWGVWTRAALPVDNRLDMPDAENIAWLCDFTGSLIRPSLCHACRFRLTSSLWVGSSQVRRAAVSDCVALSLALPGAVVTLFVTGSRTSVLFQDIEDRVSQDMQDIGPGVTGVAEPLGGCRTLARCQRPGWSSLLSWSRSAR
jgi:hypothetical protein